MMMMMMIVNEGAQIDMAVCSGAHPNNNVKLKKLFTSIWKIRFPYSKHCFFALFSTVSTFFLVHFVAELSTNKRAYFSFACSAIRVKQDSRANWCLLVLSEASALSGILVL